MWKLLVCLLNKYNNDITSNFWPVAAAISCRVAGCLPLCAPIVDTPDKFVALTIPSLP
jgi:hypothetical protein